MTVLCRFQEVLVRFIAGTGEKQCNVMQCNVMSISDEALHGGVPLPAHRTQEISFVLKAVATLISSLKRGHTEVDNLTWTQVTTVLLYLLRCTELFR